MRRSRRAWSISERPDSEQPCRPAHARASTASTARRIATLSRFTMRYSCWNTRSWALSRTELIRTEGRACDGIQRRQAHPRAAQQPRCDDGSAEEHERIVDVALPGRDEDHSSGEQLLVGQDQHAAETRGGHRVEVPAPPPAEEGDQQQQAKSRDDHGGGQHRQPGSEAQADRIRVAPRVSAPTRTTRRRPPRGPRRSAQGSISDDAEHPRLRRPSNATRAAAWERYVPASPALSGSPRITSVREGRLVGRDPAGQEQRCEHREQQDPAHLRLWRSELAEKRAGVVGPQPGQPARPDLAQNAEIVDGAVGSRHTQDVSCLPDRPAAEREELLGEEQAECEYSRSSRLRVRWPTRVQASTAHAAGKTTSASTSARFHEPPLSFFSSPAPPRIATDAG